MLPEEASIAKRIIRRQGKYFEPSYNTSPNHRLALKRLLPRFKGRWIGVLAI